MTTTRIGLSSGAVSLLLSSLFGCGTAADQELIRQRAEYLYHTGEPQSGDGQFRGEARGLRLAPTVAEVSARADLDTYLRYGMHNNAGLRAVFERWRAAMERVPQVTSLPDPVLSFGYFIEEVQTRTGPQKRRYGLSQKLPWFGKRDLRGDVAGGLAEELWQAVEAERLEVARDISVAYYEYGYLAQSVRITNENLTLLRQLDPVVQRRIASGSGGQEDLLRLQVEIGKLENQAASFDKIRPALSARLASVMNWPDRQVLPLPKLAEPKPLDPSVATLLERAEQRNPKILRLRESIKKNHSARQLAGRERWPDVTLGVDYIETGDAASPVPGSGDDPVALSLMFNLPIWGGRYAAAEREADRQLEATRYALADVRVSLRADVELAAFQAGDAARQVALYRETLLPRASESLTVTRASYRAGRASLLDVIDSERARLQFEIAFWRACRDQFQSQARLQALVGGEIR